MCIFEYDEEQHMRSEREVWKNEGMEIERKETLVKNVEFVMESFKVALQSACKSLKISVAEYERYKEHIDGKADYSWSVKDIARVAGIRFSKKMGDGKLMAYELEGLPFEQYVSVPSYCWSSLLHEWHPQKLL